MIHVVGAMYDWENLETIAGSYHSIIDWHSEHRAERPRVNPARIALAMGMVVYVVKRLECKASAVLMHDGVNWVIRVSANAPTSAVRIDIAHEISEWILRRAGYCHEDIETLCDAFAYVMLMPADLLRPRLGGDPWRDIDRIAELFDVPLDAVAIRLALMFGVPAAIIDRGEVVRVNDWGPDMADEWLRSTDESTFGVRVVFCGKLKIVIKT